MEKNIDDRYVEMSPWHILLGIVTGGVIGFCLGFAVQTREINHWVDAYQDMSKSQRYYFDIANRNHLLDLCYNVKNELGVYAKEECMKN